jgi:hypothetical protein
MQTVAAYSVDDVALWLFCQGMGENISSMFRRNDVDGSMLVTLSFEKLVNELGLGRLQTKRVLRSIEFTQGIVASKSCSSTAELETEVAKLQNENDDLKIRLLKLQAQVQPSTSTVPVA